MLGSDRLGGAKTFVRMRRRHLDIDDGDIGAMLVDGRQELIAGARLRDDSEARFLQQAGDALSEQQRVVRDDEPQRHALAADARMLAPESSSFGMKPRAWLPSRRGPYASASRLEVSTTNGG